MSLAPGESPVAIASERRLIPGEAFGQTVPVAESESESVWASWRADQKRSGRTAKKPQLPLASSWSRKFDDRLTPVCSGYGLLFFGTAGGKIVALDAKNGQSRWQYFAGAAAQASPYLWQGRLFVGDEDGYVHCLRADNGKCMWRFRAALAADRTVGYGRYASLWPVAGGVLVHDGTAYCAAGLLPSEGAITYALDAATGAVQWQQANTDTKRNYRFAHVPGGAMALSDDYLYIPTRQAAPWKINIGSADRASSTAEPTLFSSRRGGPEIMVVDDRLISVARGKEYVWHVKYVAEDTDPRLPVVVNEFAYLLNRRASGVKGGCLVAVKQVQSDEAKPEIQLVWKAWPGEPMNVLIEAGGVILSGGADKLYATNRADGKQLWSTPVPSEVTDLAYHGGRLFVVCRSGEVLCFDESRSQDP